MDNSVLIVNTKASSYPIYIGKGLLGNLSSLYPSSLGKKAVLITDSNVNAFYGETVKGSLIDAGWNVKELLIIPAGESSKSFKIIEKLAGEILQSGIDRSTTIFALGGGVVGDLSGFLSSMLLRGIDFIQLPTSLLAQVDSSVGGKTGINTAEGKNLIGAFYQPKMVVIDIDSLSTLPPREFKAGYAEIAKYGMMYDAEFWQWLQKNAEKLLSGDIDSLKYAIFRSCEIKAEIVAKDEKETLGMRELLNFGHSFGHALERIAGYDAEKDDIIKHGEAVAIGMVMAANLSEKLKICPQFLAEELKRHFIALNISVKPSFSVTAEEILEAMRFDKKNKDDKIHLILLEDIGKAVVRNDVSSETLLSFLMETIKEWK